MNLLDLLQNSRTPSSLLTHIPDIDSLSPRPGEVFEVQGPAGSGKSFIVYHVLATCISSWNKIAVLIDTDGSFDIAQFSVLLRSRLANSNDHLFSEALANLHIFRVSSSVNMAVTLLNLPSYLASKSPNMELGFLAIDSISAFYWPDRLHAESSQPIFLRPLTHVLQILSQLRSSYAPLIFLTNHALLIDPVTSLYKQHLHPFPDPFYTRSVGQQSQSPLQLTHHITLWNLIRSESTALHSHSEVNIPCVTGLIRTPGSPPLSRTLHFRCGTIES